MMLRGEPKQRGWIFELEILKQKLKEVEASEIHRAVYKNRGTQGVKERDRNGQAIFT